VNPYRVATAALAVACVILYALLRIWNDPGASPTRRVLLSLCFLVSVFSFVMAHLSVWGRTRLPPFEMRFEFWRLIAIAAATVLIACAYCSVSWCVRKRPDARL
jgi:hypothetical protein